MSYHLRAAASAAVSLCLVAAGSRDVRAQAAQAAPAAPASQPAASPTVDASATSPSALAPFKVGKRYFNADASGALYVRDGEAGAPRLLMAAGSYATLAPSPNGKYLAYAQQGSSDVKVRDVGTGTDLGEVLHNAGISRAPWTHNEKGFFYTREDSSDHRQRVYYHSLGRGEAGDAVIVSDMSHPDWRYEARVSDDGAYAVFTISHAVDSNTLIYFIDLNDAEHPKLDNPIVRLAQSFDARYEFIDNAGSYFFLQTHRGAPNGRLVLANTDVTREDRWPSLLAETNEPLLFARTAGDEYVVAVYRAATGVVARVYGPPDPAKLRAEQKRRIDSVLKARSEEDRQNRQSRTIPLRGEFSPIRVELRGDIPIAAQASIVAVNAVATDEQLFYTVRLPDGTLQSFVYDVKKARTAPFPPAKAGDGGSH